MKLLNPKALAVPPVYKDVIDHRSHIHNLGPVYMEVGNPR